MPQVKHSILLDGAKAGHFAYIGNSLIGRDANLGAGTKLANLRFDRGTIFVSDGDERVSTGMKKLGAVVGDGCELGCNVVTNPATLLGKRCMVLPASCIRGVHPAGATLKGGPS